LTAFAPTPQSDNNESDNNESDNNESDNNESDNNESDNNERLTVVIPTYNEAENLSEMAHALFALDLPNLQLLVVDDNSPDGTGEIAEQLAAYFNAGIHPAERPRMIVIHRTAKGGLGTAYVTGMMHALQEDADGAAHTDYVVQMDADFSHSPDYIAQMLEVMRATDADVIVGSRYVPGGSLDAGWGWGRRFLSWWANLYSRLILGLRTRDMTAGFKLWRRSALLGMDLANVRSNGYSFQVEMAYLCEKLGYHVIELPIHFEDRRIGQSKLDIPVKLESAWRTWQIRWRYRHLARDAKRGRNAAPNAPGRTTGLHDWPLATGKLDTPDHPSQPSNQ